MIFWTDSEQPLSKPKMPLSHRNVMALSPPNPPGEELAPPGQNETQRGRKFSAHHYKQSVESSGAGLSFFF